MDTCGDFVRFFLTEEKGDEAKAKGNGGAGTARGYDFFILHDCEILANFG